MVNRGVIGVPVPGSEVKNNIPVKMVPVRYVVKSYDLPSEYGIEGGRISKLALYVHDECIANYDRGWDIDPVSYEAQFALEILKYEFN